MSHKIVKYDVPFYHSDLILVFSNDFKKTALDLKLNIGDDDLNDYGAFVFPSKNKNNFQLYYVFFNQNPSHCSIAHEITHLVNYILKDFHIKHDFDNDEPQAYLTGWIADKIYFAKDKK